MSVHRCAGHLEGRSEKGAVYTARMTSSSTSTVLTMTLSEWQTFLANLYERDERLERREAGETYPPDETVDAYTFSAHAEAMQSAEVDGDLWGTLEDIEENAATEEDAWQKIVAFYLERGCVLLKITDAPEREEWLISEELARRLGLT